jgi:hypothetical protein
MAVLLYEQDPEDSRIKSEDGWAAKGAAAKRSVPAAGMSATLKKQEFDVARWQLG